MNGYAAWHSGDDQKRLNWWLNSCRKGSMNFYACWCSLHATHEWQSHERTGTTLPLHSNTLFFHPPVSLSWCCSFTFFNRGSVCGGERGGVEVRFCWRLRWSEDERWGVARRLASRGPKVDEKSPRGVTSLGKSGYWILKHGTKLTAMDKILPVVTWLLCHWTTRLCTQNTENLKKKNRGKVNEIDKAMFLFHFWTL